MISPLKRTTEVVKHRHDGSPSNTLKSPGRTDFEAIDRAQGDPRPGSGTGLANKVWRGQPGSVGVSLKDFRKDMILEVWQADGSHCGTRSSAAGSPNIRRCPSWTPTPTRWRFSISRSRTRLVANVETPRADRRSPCLRPSRDDTATRAEGRRERPAGEVELSELWERGWSQSPRSGGDVAEGRPTSRPGPGRSRSSAGEAALLSLRTRLFGEAMAGWSDCPACGVEMSSSCGSATAWRPQPSGDEDGIRCCGYRSSPACHLGISSRSPERHLGRREPQRVLRALRDAGSRPGCATCRSRRSLRRSSTPRPPDSRPAGRSAFSPVPSCPNRWSRPLDAAGFLWAGSRRLGASPPAPTSARLWSEPSSALSPWRMGLLPRHGPGLIEARRGCDDGRATRLPSEPRRPLPRPEKGPSARASRRFEPASSVGMRHARPRGSRGQDLAAIQTWSLARTSSKRPVDRPSSRDEPTDGGHLTRPAGVPDSPRLALGSAPRGFRPARSATRFTCQSRPDRTSLALGPGRLARLAGRAFGRVRKIREVEVRPAVAGIGDGASGLGSVTPADFARTSMLHRPSRSLIGRCGLPSPSAAVGPARRPRPVDQAAACRYTSAGSRSAPRARRLPRRRRQGRQGRRCAAIVGRLSRGESSS